MLEVVGSRGGRGSGRGQARLVGALQHAQACLVDTLEILLDALYDDTLHALLLLGLDTDVHVQLLRELAYSGCVRV